MNAYHPTLWRTSRVLANVNRLACLKTVLLQPAITVGDVAVAARIPENQASMCLRALQSRGLISAQRVSRWTRYLPKADSLVEHSTAVLKAVRKALIAAKMPEREIIRTLTAFTHPRRLAILACLQTHPRMERSCLSAATRISQPALLRHLTKLGLLGLVAEQDDVWRLTAHPDALAAAFLRVLSSGGLRSDVGLKRTSPFKPHPRKGESVSGFPTLDRNG